MESSNSVNKKRLDFTRPTFDELEFKIPCRDMNSNQSNCNETTERSSHQSGKSAFADDEDDSSRESNASSLPSVNTTEKVSVYLRIKPTKEEIPPLYDFSGDKVTLKGNQLNQLTAVDRQYTFTTILDQSVDQTTLYNKCVRPVLSDPFASAGAVYASYGVSNSGKTYTILGEKSAGVVPRALTQIFSEYEGHISPYPCIKLLNDQISILDDSQVEAEVDQRMDFLKESRKLNKGKLLQSWAEDIKADHRFERKEADECQKIHVWVSFVEIYKEKMVDLLKAPKATAATRSLKIISNKRNSYVHGLTWLHISNIKDALELLQHALLRVKYASTALNPHSSRSHTIFTINLISESASSFEFSSFKFCDLAGAERASKTENQGERLKEAGVINGSLLVLGRCLEAVRNNQKLGSKKEIVPVRESKLTFLLQSSLTGNEKFVMIVNLLPNVECFEENVNVLHFGSIANKIITRKMKPRKMSRSTRYSYFLQHAVNSPNRSSAVYDDSSFAERDESFLDLSYQRNNMTKEELIRELYRKDLECDLFRKAVEDTQRDFIQKEREIREQMATTQKIYKESELKYFESKETLLRNYYEKKMESMSIKHERLFNDLLEENDYLEQENRKLKSKLGIVDDEDVIDLNEEEDDEIEESSAKANCDPRSSVQDDVIEESSKKSNCGQHCHCKH